ncbi:S8 family peptidase [Halobacteriovorax sp. HLS]|uniref:S8 family peptidase n=1 Tax=Halobacteriovorax sp. HLS TaxID=2234000 RepID=UPI0013E36BCC|nr:S8 family peptidase [Halobacteriovorax sp. HLS]
MKKTLILCLLSLQTFANDPLSSLQWALENNAQPIFRSTGELTREFVRGVKGEDLDLPKDLVLTKNKTIVAVIDSGVDIEHPDLKDNIWTNPKCNELTLEQRADQDCHGWNFLDGNNDLIDEIGHGTHVAGIIAATSNNGIGIKGVASQNALIMPLKILNPKVNSFVYDKKVITNIIADAIAYAIKNGAQVINLSLGWPKLIHTKKVRFAIDQAIAKNIAVVVASGNNNKKIPVYPCAYDEVICVGAMDNKGNIPEFSNFGAKVDVIAPGEGIISTYPRNLESRLLRIPGYEIKKGSSQAAPYVSGLIALDKSRNSDLSLDEIKQRLFTGARKIEGQKIIKYGKVSFTGYESVVLEDGHPEFNLKGLSEVVINEDGRFSFSLPVRALVKDIPSLNFKVTLGHQGNTLFEQSFDKVKVLNSKHREIRVTGTLDNFSIDSHIPMTIEFNEKSITHELAFVREVDKIDNKVTLTTNLPAKNLITIQSGRKFSRLQKVISTNYASKSFDYFYEIIGSPDTKVQIAKISSTDVLESVFTIPKVGKILNIVKNDFNFDGIDDYMIYSLGKKSENLILSYLTNDGAPLFNEYSHWTFPISGFEGLPFFNNEIKFDFLKVETSFMGAVKVPTFMKTWKMPEADNTLDPLDRIDSEFATKRPYYLLPKLVDGKVVLDIRTLSSYKFLEDFKKKFNVSSRDELYFDTIITQNLNAAKDAKLSAIVITGREFAKRYYEVVFSNTSEYEVKEIGLWGRSLESNKTLINDDLLSNERASFALIDRQKLRVQFWNNIETGDVLEFDTGSWGDLIIDVLNLSQNLFSKALFIESRYFIHLATNTGVKSKLPINRESSFPGVNFSETIKQVKVSNSEGNSSALLIDSSLIYGDRLYAMVYDNGEFSSPIYSSFKVPANCKHVDTLNSNDESTLLLTCLQKDGSATIELLKLEQRVE